jgi:hypothetical protein
MPVSHRFAQPIDGQRLEIGVEDQLLRHGPRAHSDYQGQSNHSQP